MPTIEGGAPPDFLIFFEGIPRRQLSLAWKPEKSNRQFRRYCDHWRIEEDPNNRIKTKLLMVVNTKNITGENVKHT